MTKKSKGLGDTISKITEATGIKSVVDKISEITGVPCNCEKRKQALNKLFPYARPFTDDELKVYLEVLPRLKSGQINGQDNATLTKLYNKVFNANKKPTRCTSCVKETIAKLAKVYVNTCEV